MDAFFIRALFYLYTSLFFATPLVMFHKTSELFEFNKILFVYAITACVVATWLARMILHKRIILKNTLLSLPLGIFFVSQVVSTVTSIDVSTSFFGYYGRFNGGLLSIAAYIVLYLAFVSNFSTKDLMRKALRISLISSLVSALVVMLWGLPSKFGYDLSCLFFTGKLNVECWTEQFKPTIRVFSTMGQPNWLGAYLAVQFFIGAYFFLINRDKQKESLLYGVFLFFTTIMLLYTRSKSAVLAVGIGIIMLSLFLIKEKSIYLQKASHKKYIGALVGALLIGLLIAKTGVQSIDSLISFTRAPKEVTTGTQVSQSDPKNIVITDSFAIRKIVWQGGFTLGQMYPLFGTGVETFAYSYNFVRPREHNPTSEWDYVYNKAHNEFINYLATTGYIGLLTYLIFLGVVISQIMHAFVKNELKTNDKLLIICLEASFASLVITNFFGFSTTVSNVYLYMIPALIILVLERAKGVEHRLSNIGDQLTDKQKGFLSAVGIVLALSIVWVFNYLRADIHYAKGENFSAFQEYGSALNELYKAYSLRGEHVYADKISQVLAQIAVAQSLSDKEKAADCPSHDGRVATCVELTEEYTKRAHDGSPKNVYYYRTAARNYILLYQATQDAGYYDKANEALKSARDLAPTDPRYPYTQALFHLAKFESTSKPTEADRRDLELGLGAAEFALKLKQDYRDGYYAKGLILKQLGRKDEAKTLFNEYLSTYNSKDEQFLNELQGL